MSQANALFGYDLFGDPIEQRASGPLAKRFMFPPFSVIDLSRPNWQERKRAWIAKGIQSELGRDAKSYNTDGNIAGDKTGVSVFDPVVCEISYQWFCPPSGLVVDPFAGGSVRGIVAGDLGLIYHGIELRQSQVEANRRQASEIMPVSAPAWVHGDAEALLPNAPVCDFLFSCPPYGDLEVYSNDPADLSNMDWPAFLGKYRRIISKAVARLKDDRFAAFVVGDFRDSRGHYRNFIGETVSAFVDAGAPLYNEIILQTPLGTLPQRVTKQFENSRKIGKTHQQLLVFCKGDGKKAASHLASSVE